MEEICKAWETNLTLFVRYLPDGRKDRVRWGTIEVRILDKILYPGMLVYITMKIKNIVQLNRFINKLVFTITVK